MNIRLRIPDTLVLLFALVLLAYGLTWLLPAGSFDTTLNEHGREVVVPGTYARLDTPPPPVWTVLTAIPRGLSEAQGIIFFVLIIGGALAVIRATGALDAALGRLLERYAERPAMLILVGITAFAIGSSTIGMATEYIPLMAVLVTLCVGMRMDTMAAVGIVVVGYGIGYGAAVLNPFTVLVAQEVAGLTPVSGAGLRLAMFVPFVALGVWHVWRYAVRVRADASASLVADVPEAQPPPAPQHPDMSARHLIILLLTAGSLALIVWGIVTQGWYLTELSAVFVALAIAAGLVARLSLDNIAQRFTVGAAELTGTALLIGVARAIELTLRDGQVLHTIVDALATPLMHVGGSVAAVGMLLIQSLINLVISSGSGQAYVTMPLMAPIADLVGVSRQVAVLAFQMGDGFTNMVAPTNPVLMGILGICGIPYERWLRFILPLLAQILALGAVVLVIAVAIGYQ